MSEREQGLEALLRSRFGFAGFRAGQREVIDSVMSGRPTVAIMPTGSGKSLCYQLPALALDGLTLVVSPLLSLMKDQVDSLSARAIEATFVNSSLSETERSRRLTLVRDGRFKLLYVAPERFRSPQFVRALAGLRVSLFAIDEAHCISQWGHDFRPDYARLAEARDQLGAERTLALTATATPEVRSDITRALGMSAPAVFVAGFDRPNLFLEVHNAKGDREKLDAVAALASEGATGIVYAATRRNVEKTVDDLRRRGLDALGYHAGLADDVRVSVQEQFMKRPDVVVVATNAFGMGVDRSDVRFVAHFDIPRSVEAYYQEIGRAGRDGLPARALLLFNHADVFMQERILQGSHPSREIVRATWKALAAWPGPADAATLAHSIGAAETEAASALKLLERAGHAARTGRGYAALDAGLGADALTIDFGALKARAATERTLLRRMSDFAYTRPCRRRYLLNYFGDQAASRCEACDRCVRPRPLSAPPPLLERADRGLRAAAVLREEAGPVLDQVAYEALVALRREIAKADAVPPYVVFHDSMLRALARELPQTREAFVAINGLGEKRWEKYGARVLAIVGSRPRTSPPRPEPAPTPPPLPRDADESPTSEPGTREDEVVHAPPPPRMSEAESRSATLALFRQGLGLPEIATLRNLAPTTVAGHLADLVQAGERIDVDRVLEPARQTAIRAAASDAPPDLVAVKSKLAFQCTLGEIRLALASTPRSATSPSG